MEYQAPLAGDVDVLVLGGSTSGVAAALSAREQGAQVLCATMFPYFGEDVCSFARYWFDVEGMNVNPLGERLYEACASAENSVPRPMDIKYPLERTLIDADIPFIYETSPVCLLRDREDQVAGCVVANRSGFLAIRAKTIIDVTDRALAGRMSRASFEPFQPGEYTFERVVVTSGTPPEPRNAEVEDLSPGVAGEEDVYPAYKYTFTFELNEPPGLTSSRQLEVPARLESWDPGQIMASDRLFRIPQDRLVNGCRQNDLCTGEGVDAGTFKCGEDHVWVLGPCADLTDEAAWQLAEPGTALKAGWRLGKELGACSVRWKSPADVHASAPQQRTSDGEVRKEDRYFRLSDSSVDLVPLDLNCFPRVGNWHTVIAGGGTAGAPAGIAAGRAGVNALVLENLYTLGGVGTAGRIAHYHHGNRCGFTQEIDEGVDNMGPGVGHDYKSVKWNTAWKAQWFLQEISRAGTEVCFGTHAVAALCRGERVSGVLAVSPEGAGLVEAETVIDSTGNADVAAAAGAEVVNIGGEHVAVQGTGLPPIIPEQDYTNTDYTFIDDTDVMDVTRGFATGREKFRNSFDLAQIVDSRQRRQIKGEITLDPVDFYTSRTFPDSIVLSKSNFDSHGYTVHPLFMAKPPDKQEWGAYVPFRALLPRGLHGILVTGLGISAHRDALPVTRMQPDVQNQGYAAGYVAAMAVKNQQPFRSLDIGTLQGHLVEKGILEADVPEHEDAFPLEGEKIEQAVNDGIDDYEGLAVMFADPGRSIPLLREKVKDTGDHWLKVQYARVLALLGDDTGAETLRDTLRESEWDEGWNFTGLGQFGMSMSDVDAMLVALASTGHRDAAGVIRDKVETLSADMDFSHFRAIALALEALPVPEAAPAVEKLLTHPRIRGACKKSLKRALAQVPESHKDTSERNQELSEIHLARALLACGDPDGKAREVLEEYTEDLHGHYARHARALLRS